MRLSFLGWNGSLWVTMLGLALNMVDSFNCFCSSFTCKFKTALLKLKNIMFIGETPTVHSRTICSSRVLLTAPRWSMSSLKGSGFVASGFFFSGRMMVSKFGSSWALNWGTCNCNHNVTGDYLLLWNATMMGFYVFTSSILLSSNFFSFSALLSCSLSSNENGQTSTWRFCGNWGWNGRPKWGTEGVFLCGGCLTWGTL